MGLTFVHVEGAAAYGITLAAAAKGLNAEFQQEVCRQIDKARFNVTRNTLQVISGTGFYGSNDPTNSVKALKEDRS